MAITQRLDLRQSQSLVMTPQLQQAIKLLQLNNIELSAYVEQELERNPLLEQNEDLPDPAATSVQEPAAGSGEDSRPDNAGDAPADTPVEAQLDPGFAEEAPAEITIDENGIGAEPDQALDADFGEVYSEDGNTDRAQEQTDTTMSEVAEPGLGGGMDAPGLNTGLGGNTRGGSFDDENYSIENTLSEDVDLREHLNQQLALAVQDPAGRLIGAALVDGVEEDGYIREALTDIAERLGADIDRVEEVLAVIQTFDPPGIGARDLAECLAIQLKEQNRYDPAIAAMLDNLDLLAKQDYNALMRICEVDEEDLADMVSDIRGLDPKPGRQFESNALHAVVPDVFLRQKPDGGWAIELNTDTLPRVLVNNHYYAEVSGKTKNTEDKTYLTECYATANWLVKSLDQRANTILKVATELVRQQDSFFVLGVQYLRPLNLKTIADVIGMHESTVSRVTTNKYIGTPRGIFEMKYFFTAAIPSTTGGDAFSAESVRHRIKELIDHEIPESVLSDDRIVEILRAEDIDIARRTVAKYREAMRIPSSVQRRRQKKLEQKLVGR